MRTDAAFSPPSSDSSILSSFDGLSLASPTLSSLESGTGSRRSSTFSHVQYPSSPESLSYPRVPVDVIDAGHVRESSLSATSSWGRSSFGSATDSEAESEIILVPSSSGQLRSGVIILESYNESDYQSSDDSGFLGASGVLVGLPGSSESQRNSGSRTSSQRRDSRQTEREIASRGLEQDIAGPSTSTTDSTPRAPRTVSRSTENDNSNLAGGELSVAEKGKGKGRKTRRGGKKVIARRERAKAVAADDKAVDDLLFDAGSEATPRKLSTTTTRSFSSSSSGRSYEDDDDDGSTEYSEDGASRFLGEDEDEDEDGDEEDEVDALSDLGSSEGSRKVEGSVMSTEDAKSSIDSFLADSIDFTSDKANKLRLWQALCVELGLVDLGVHETLPDLPSSRPSRPIERDDSASRSRSVTPTPASPNPSRRLVPLPQTLASAKRLLKDRAHVNLMDYFEARELENQIVNAGGDKSLLRKAQGATFEHLVHPSSAAMMRYTKTNKRMVKLDVVKAEWLNPLLRDFGYKRSRQARAGVRG